MRNSSDTRGTERGLQPVYEVAQEGVPSAGVVPVARAILQAHDVDGLGQIGEQWGWL
jgi:hypothetical protein